MSLRRFLNLVTLNSTRGIYSLRHIDLLTQPLFYPTAPAEQKKINLQGLSRIMIPPLGVNFHPNPSPLAENHEWKMHFFGLSENKIICTDNCGLTFLYDASLRCIQPMPSLHTPKWLPIPLSTPDPDEQDGRLYMMEKAPRPSPDKGQFEAFVYTVPGKQLKEKVWHRHSLPLPPFIAKPGFDETTCIRSYAVLGGGSHLCISFTGIVGTYCFDTASREWSHLGDWKLPIFGKATYIPEHNLWFGLSEDRRPCVSDLSTALNSEKPELCGIWGDYYPPDWKPLGTPKIVSLGSGRFCILDFFEIMLKDSNRWGEQLVDVDLAVFTGVELLACEKCGKLGNSTSTGSGSVDGSGSNGQGNGNGEQELRMVIHKSRIYDGDESIEAVL